MFGRIVVASAVAALVLCACTGAIAATRGPAAARAGAADSPCSGANEVIVDEASRLQGVSTLLCLVNRRRAAARAGALHASAALTGAAGAYSTAMVARRFFGHAGGADGLRGRALRAGYVLPGERATLGETIAWGAGTMATPAQLMDAFVESPAHLRTLLYARFRDAGVGIALGAPLRGAGGPAATVTVDFGRR